MTDSSGDNANDLASFKQEFFNTKSAEPPVEDHSGPVDDPAPADTIDINPDELVDPTPESVQESKLKLKPKQTAQERINDITAKFREAERALEAIKAENERLRIAKEQEQKPPTEQVATPAPEAPDAFATLADGTPKYPLGDYDPQYLKDVVTFEKEQLRAEAKKAIEDFKKEFVQDIETSREQADLMAAENELLQTWESKLSETEKAIPDLRAKAATLEPVLRGIDQAYGEYLSQTVMAMDRGPEVLYYLADHPEEAREIINSGPRVATMRLGALEARLPVKTDKLVTNAPEPPSRNKGTGRYEQKGDILNNYSAFKKEFFK